MTNSKKTNIQTTASADDSPPILSSWKQLYYLVLIAHAIIIGIFYFFSVYYS